MITSKIINLIKKHENCDLMPYNDSLGYPTIGWGRLIRPGESFPDGITQDQADLLLLKDLETAEIDVRSLISNFDDLCEPRQAVLTDMAFNMGRQKLSEFHHFLAAIRDENFMMAAHEMKDSIWFSQVKTRGEEDYQMMITGEWIA